MTPAKPDLAGRVPQGSLRRRLGQWRRALSNLVPVGASEAVIRELRDVLSGGRTVILGPWLSEVGFEVQCWVAFLKWVQTEYGLPASRCAAVSRGGVAYWYRGLADRYLELFDYCTPDTFREALARRAALTGRIKQMSVQDFDREVIAWARAQVGDPRAAVLHPSIMYRLFMPFWCGEAGFGDIAGYLRSRPSWSKGDLEPIDGLPARYVAVKLYASEQLPATPENQTLMALCIQALAQREEVVLLDTNFRVDDHSEFTLEASARVHSLGPHLVPSTNLMVQTRAIAHAQAFVGTCGGLAWVAPMLGVRTYAAFSNLRPLVNHIFVAHRTLVSYRHDLFVPIHIRYLPALLDGCSGVETWLNEEEVKHE